MDRELASSPPQVHAKMYTEEDMRHVVAREIVKQQISQLQSGQLATEKRMVEMVTEFNSKIGNLIEFIQKQPDKMDKCRDELRNEIEKDYPNKIDLLTLENHMKTENDRTNKKIDIQWIKITLVVGTVVSVITVLGGIVNYYILIAKFTQGG